MSKLEHLLNLFSFYFFWQFFFIIKYLNNTISLLFLWKITNYADSYWFLYSNKKSIYENLNISKISKIRK